MPSDHLQHNHMLLKVCSQCGYEAIIKNCKSIKILSDKFVKWYDQYPQYLEDLALGSNLNQLLSNDLIQYELKETNSIKVQNLKD